MKVLHYVDESNLAWGETWVQLLSELAKRGVENFVACRDYGTLTERLEKNGVSFGVCRPISQMLPFTNTKLGGFIDEFKPDLIHTRLSSAAKIGGWWGKHRHIPVLQTIDQISSRRRFLRRVLDVGQGLFYLPRRSRNKNRSCA